MSEKTTSLLPVKLIEAQPADYPVIARLLGENFPRGKYRLAFGKDAARRVSLIAILLRHQALTEGRLLVAQLEDGRVAGTVVLKLDNTAIPAESRRAARREIAQRVGPLRAWWAMWALRLFRSPKVGPQSCYVDNLVVNPTIRRQRIAARMALLVYDLARSQGKTEVFADILSSNWRVQGLVNAEGWEIVGRNYLVAPITLPILGFAGIFRIRKSLVETTSSSST